MKNPRRLAEDFFDFFNQISRLGETPTQMDVVDFYVGYGVMGLDMVICWCFGDIF